MIREQAQTGRLAFGTVDSFLLWRLTGGRVHATEARLSRAILTGANLEGAKLKGALMGGNVDKTMAAPVTAIVAYDTEFHEHIPAVLPFRPELKDTFEANEPLRSKTAQFNATLQDPKYKGLSYTDKVDNGPVLRDYDDNQLIRVPKAGHMVTVEQPDRVLDALKLLG